MIHDGLAVLKEPMETMLYGSLEQGIALDCSDIDIAIFGLHFSKDKEKLIVTQTLLFDELCNKMS